MKRLLQVGSTVARSLLITLCLLAPDLLRAETPSPEPRLAGIINLPGSTLALLEISSTRPGPPGGCILTVGQREGPIEILSIKPEIGSIQVRPRPEPIWNVKSSGKQTTNAPRTWDASTGKEIASPPGAVQSVEFSTDGRRVVTSSNSPVTLTFRDQTFRLEPGRPGLLLEGAGLNQVLTLYQQFVGRTLLIHPALPAVAFTLNAAAANPAEAALVLQKEFATHGIATIPDGDKFTMIVPQAQVASAKPHSPHSGEIKRPDAEKDQAPSGAINFQDLVLVQAAIVYAELVGRKLDQSGPPYSGTIRINTQTALSRDEVLYAFDVLFAWRGLKAVPQGDDQLKLVTIPDSER